jgi:hypothetical protein
MPSPKQTAQVIQLHPVLVDDPVMSRTLEGLRLEIQQALQKLGEQIDSSSGLRGSPALYADMDARGHRLRKVGKAEDDDDVPQRGQTLYRTADGKTFDARGIQIVNVGTARAKGNAVPFEQLLEEMKLLLESPVFTGLVTIADLLLTGTLTHTGPAIGVFGTAPAGQQAAIAALTDGTGATANDAIENVPASTGDAGGIAMVSAAANVATVASVNTSLTAIENDLADLTAKVNAITAALRTYGWIAP